MNQKYKCKFCKKGFTVNYWLPNGYKPKFCCLKCFYDFCKRSYKYGFSHKAGFKKGHKTNIGRKRLDITAEKHPKWKGGKRKTSQGYMVLRDYNNRTKDGYIGEHRIVAEGHLGHKLKEEVIHHINGKKDDNRIENLYLFKNNGKHRSYEMRLKNSKVEPITASNLI